MENSLQKRTGTSIEFPITPQLGNETYVFDLNLENEKRQREFGRGEIEEVSRISDLKISNRPFVLSEMGQCSSRQYILEEAYAVAEDILEKYNPNKLSISGSIIQSVKSGLEIKFETDGETNLQMTEAIERARSRGMKIGSLESPKDIINV